MSLADDDADMDEPADRATQCNNDFLSTMVDDLNELPSCDIFVAGDDCKSPDVSFFFFSGK